MSHSRFARISLMVAALGLSAPVLLSSAYAQSKPAAAPAADAPKPDTVRPELFKLLDPAMVKELMTAKNYPAVQEKITAAEAFPNRTPYETYVIDRMKLALGSATQNDKMAMTALEAIIASKRLPPADQNEFVLALANYHYNGKNYPKAIELFKQYQADGGTPSRVRGAIIRAQYLSGDYAGAKAGLLEVIAENDKAAVAPQLEDLRLLASSGAKLKDVPTYIMATERLVAYYPNDDYWTDLLHRMASKPGFDEKLQLDVWRLEFQAQTVLAPEEYTELAELALLAGYPTEAKKAVDAGYAANVLGSGTSAAKHKQLRDKANKGAADDAKNIGSGEAGALKAKDGLPLVNLGYAYVTMEQFDKGIPLMEQGIAKGVSKRPQDAKLHLGIAYAKAGRKADAIKVFEGIKGEDGSGDLAKYWMLWLNRPATPAAAAAAAK
jgi:hypothetical protein